MIAGIGHNAIPLAERLAMDHADLVKEAAEAAALVPDQIRAIETDEEAAAYTDTAADIKGILAQADAAFTVEKAPWLAGGRTVDGFFGFRAKLDASFKRVKLALDARADALRAAQRKAEAAAQEAARLAALAETERLRKEAEAFDEPAPAPVVAAYVAPVPVKDIARVVSSTTGNRASAAVNWTHRVVDADLVPREYLMVNEAAIKAAVKGGKRSIPGVEIFEAANTRIARR